MCESAALELGCVVNDIRHVIVCGHSDCKAMNLLYALRDEEFASQVRLFRVFPIFLFLFEKRVSSLSFPRDNASRISDEQENVAAESVAVRARQQQPGEVSAPRDHRFPRADHLPGWDAAAKIRRLHRSGGQVRHRRQAVAGRYTGRGSRKPIAWSLITFWELASCCRSTRCSSSRTLRRTGSWRSAWRGTICTSTRCGSTFTPATFITSAARTRDSSR